MPASTALQDGWLNHCFRQTAFTMPTAWWVVLHYGLPGANCTSNVWNIPRVQCTGWSAVSSSSVSNSSAITWANCPDPGANNVMTYASIWTASTGGTALAYVPLTNSITVRTGDTLRLPAGTLVINNVLPTDLGTISGAYSLSLVAPSTVKMTLSGDLNLSGGIAAPSAAAWRTLIVAQNSPGGWQITWPTLRGTTPVLDPTASAITVISLFWDGTYWHTWD